MSAARTGGDPAAPVREERTSVGGRSVRYLSHVDRPDRFAEVLGRFLDETRSR